MQRKELVVGYPINEFSQSNDLFGGSYFINYKGGLEQWGECIKGGFVEQHFQQFREVSDILDNKDKKQEFLKKVEEYRKQDIEVIMHTPFIRAHDPSGFLEFDFEWLKIPSEYKNKPIKEFPVKDKQVKMNGLEAKIEDMQKTINLASAADIKTLTVHVASPGVYFEGKDWDEFRDTFIEHAGYARSKGVTLAAETGGILPYQIEELKHHAKKNGTIIKLNLDTAHLLLDYMFIEKETLIKQGADEEDAKRAVEHALPLLNKRVDDFYRHNKDYIEVIHLTQNGLWADLHMGIEDHLGVMTINEGIIKDANSEFEEKGIKRYVMIESEPTMEGIIHFIKAKNGEITGERITGNNYSLIMCAGRPASGKSQVLSYLTDTGFIGSVQSVIRSDVLREKYAKDAFSITDWVSKEKRQIVYDEGIRRIELATSLKQGGVFDATSAQRSNRKALYDIALKNGVKEFYVLDVRCDRDEAVRRIVDRDQKIKKKEAKGEIFEGRLTMRDPDKYDRFSHEFEDIDYNTEFPNNGKMQVRAIKINTSPGKEKIELMNPNQEARTIAYTLAGKFKKDFNTDYSISEK